MQWISANSIWMSGPPLITVLATEGVTMLNIDLKWVLIAGHRIHVGFTEWIDIYLII